ncbi:MAG: adenylosuccinate lyase [Erysipelotrichaceae bacterium]|nr:MAG: adenylosuccinate [Erysipelotrichaceae bacterium]TXT19622.1 MAG: adenylosuccinate lyase [Erysipelotrichaceae bacterium]
MIQRYSRKQMSDLWTEEAKYNAWLKVELAVCEVLAHDGKITKEELVALNKASFSIERINELEKETKHDVVAFTRAVSESLGDEKRWIHYGLTSTDVVDTATGLIMKDVNALLRADLVALREVLKKQALRYKMTPCMGRTHGIHAEITSFGLKFALWFEEFNRQLKRFDEVCKDIECGKISGAVGNCLYTGVELQDDVCQILGMQSAPISTQTLQRDRHAAYMSVLALIATSLEKIAIEFRHLQRTEVREVEEGFSAGQKGSSAMPHKRNPISFENIAGLSRVIRGYMMSAYEDIPLWHERDISHSSVERIIFPDATILLDYMLNRMTGLISNIQVFEDNMLKNIELTQGVIFAQRVMNKLIDEKAFSREKAYDLIQPLAMIAWTQHKAFKGLISQDEVISSVLTQEEIESCFTLEFYLRHVDAIYKRVGL